MEVAMTGYSCPLCRQEVSRTLYEKITGVWQEKEKRLANLKIKEKQLVQREKQMQMHFEIEKKKIAGREQAKTKKELLAQKQIFQSILKKEKETLKKQKDAIEKTFATRLTKETSLILKEEKIRQKQSEAVLKAKFELSAKQMINKEKKKIEKDKKALQKQERIHLDKNKKLSLQFISLQNKSKNALEKQEKKIGLLEEQLRKNQTPQVLGLLEEKIFLEKLKQMFLGDKFIHTGKGGDIVHCIIERNEEVGIIVYELKKVSKFNNKHIVQALQAKQQRSANYGILVTNAKRSKEDFGFSLSKGIIVIHPGGALVLVAMLRDHLIRISKLKLSKTKREQAINAVLDYIQSPSFQNSIESIIEDTKDLYAHLTKEVKDHVRSWEFRLAKYRQIHNDAHKIETKAIKLLVNGEKQKKIPNEVEISSIALPSEIV